MLSYAVYKPREPGPILTEVVRFCLVHRIAQSTLGSLLRRQSLAPLIDINHSVVEYAGSAIVQN